MMRCHGLCDSIPTFSRYVPDSRFCAICGKFLQIENIGLRCPCCSSLFRIKSRPKKNTVSLYKKRELVHRY